MTVLPPSVVVFDFDGTLVSSNQLKYDAYFDLFPKDSRHRHAIEEVLSRQYEESRFVILDSILTAVEGHVHSPAARREIVSRLADAYGRIVTEGAKMCPERPGAGDLLRELSARVPLYLASTTPESPLRDILTHRGWIGLFRAVYGHPNRKSDALRDIAGRERVCPAEMLLVGDGASDRQAATEAGCRFLAVDEHTSIAVIRQATGTERQHV